MVATSVVEFALIAVFIRTLTKTLISIKNVNIDQQNLDKIKQIKDVSSPVFLCKSAVWEHFFYRFISKMLTSCRQNTRNSSLQGLGYAIEEDLQNCFGFLQILLDINFSTTTSIV